LVRILDYKAITSWIIQIQKYVPLDFMYYKDMYYVHLSFIITTSVVSHNRSVIDYFCRYSKINIYRVTYLGNDCRKATNFSYKIYI